MAVAMALFFISTVGIFFLFYIKHLEVARERALSPNLRGKADEYALDLKAVLSRSRFEIAKIPPLMVRILRHFAREGALGLASLARLGERKAYELADMVSHKHRFERRETKSEFLKQVAEHKSENGFEKNDGVR
jgi:hypothetical protein